MVNINIGICGQVSAGKTTCLNAIYGKYIGETSLKRTTMKVCSFSSGQENDSSSYIKERIENINENEDEPETAFKLDIPFTKKPDIDYTIFDFPGFNDGHEHNDQMENIFFNKLPEIDYVVFLSDAKNTMLHKSEKELFQKMITQIEQNHKNNKYTRLIIAINKYEQDDDEIEEIVDDAKNWIDEQVKDKSIILEFRRVSFRNMMVKRVLNYSKGKRTCLKTIPENILMSVMTEFHGKVKSRQIIKNKKIKESDIHMIELSDDEEGFINDLFKTVTNKFNEDWLYNKVIKEVNNKNHEILYNYRVLDYDNVSIAKKITKNSCVVKKAKYCKGKIDYIKSLLKDDIYTLIDLKNIVLSNCGINELSNEFKNNAYKLIPGEFDFSSENAGKNHSVMICIELIKYIYNIFDIDGLDEKLFDIFDVFLNKIDIYWDKVISESVDSISTKCWIWKKKGNVILSYIFKYYVEKSIDPMWLKKFCCEWFILFPLKKSEVLNYLILYQQLMKLPGEMLKV